MSIELKVPTFPESVADGTIIKWNKKPGEAVKRDESLVEIETDKVVFEVPAPRDGVLEDIAQTEGSVVVSGQVVGHLGEAAAAAHGEAAAAVREPAAAVAAAEGAQAARAGRATPAAELFAVPSARRLIEEHGLDVDAIPASGSGGRILKEDVLRVLEEPPRPKPAPPPPAQPAAAAPGAAKPQADEEAVNLEGRPERRVPMTRLRARIAERLLDAQQNAAILTTFNEINMRAVMDLRARY
ncbi:MAG: E3 binding domain-containing protein, partial [Gammaproteobacteria bacterium]